MSSANQQRLHELLNYNQETGVFCWKVDRANLKAGTITGCKAANGYLYIRIDKKLYTAHRLAWLYVHGELPTFQVDHINGCRTDNRIENLRLCTNAQNQQNRKRAQSSSNTGVMGVTFHSCGRKKPFRANIKLNGRSKGLGYFSTAEEAGDAYLHAKRQLHAYGTL